MEKDKAEGLVPMAIIVPALLDEQTHKARLDELEVLVHEEMLWLHVDLRTEGCFAFLNRFKYLTKLEQADSASLDGRLHLRCGQDMHLMWTRDRHVVITGLQFPDVSRLVEAEKHQLVDFKDLNIFLSKRSRSFKLWMVLKAYGMNPLKEHIALLAPRVKLF